MPATMAPIRALYGFNYMWHVTNAHAGLSVHMNQVHKENLTHVENANPGRQGLEIEIFGMEGVPAEIIDQHNQEVTQAHFSAEAERARLTGNPVRGAYANGDVVPNKRPKVTETLEEIEARAAKYREDRKNGVLPVPTVKEIVNQPVRRVHDIWTRGYDANTDAQTPPQIQPPYGAPAYPPQQPYIPNGGAIPPRPAVDAIQSSIDDLIAGVQKEVPADKKEDKKSKKDKNMRLIYNDDNYSPEEKMALLPKFAEFVRV